MVFAGSAPVQQQLSGVIENAHGKCAVQCAFLMRTQLLHRSGFAVRFIHKYDELHIHPHER
jgi:hypothetical protein